PEEPLAGEQEVRYERKAKRRHRRIEGIGCCDPKAGSNAMQASVGKGALDAHKCDRADGRGKCNADDNTMDKQSGLHLHPPCTLPDADRVVPAGPAYRASLKSGFARAPGFLSLHEHAYRNLLHVPHHQTVTCRTPFFAVPLFPDPLKNKGAIPAQYPQFRRKRHASPVMQIAEQMITSEMLIDFSRRVISAQRARCCLTRYPIKRPIAVPAMRPMTVTMPTDKKSVYIEFLHRWFALPGYKSPHGG